MSARAAWRMFVRTAWRCLPERYSYGDIGTSRTAWARVPANTVRPAGGTKLRINRSSDARMRATASGPGAWGPAVTVVTAASMAIVRA
jgi:hypothetical protein